MWDERFAGAGYLFGKEPAAFLVDYADWLKPGLTGLSVADGEGRNSVFMAQQGVETQAMDASPNAIAKARALAAERGVAVGFHEADIAGWDWAPARFDLVVGVFIQFVGPEARHALFEGMIRTLKPGGHLLLHGYSPKQLDYGTGGPRAIENLYTEALLREAFADLEIIVLNAYDREIDEGAGHSGMSALIDLVARKPG